MRVVYMNAAVPYLRYTWRMILIKRAYEKAEKSDGRRVLVDRLWPRGVAKAKAHLDAWEQGVAPSTMLRKWFDHDPKKFAEFKKRYRAELQSKKDLLRALKQSSRTLTLVYAAKDPKINHAVVLKEMLERI